MNSLAEAWEPDPELVERLNIVRFMKQHGVADFDSLLRRALWNLVENAGK